LQVITQEESIKRLGELTQFHIIAVMTEGSGYQEFIQAVYNRALRALSFPNYRFLCYT
jgi:hypothetical protein